MKTALITGVSGQDGSFLSEFLLNKGYFVIGLKRRTSLINTCRIDHLLNNLNFKLEYFDLNDSGRMYELLNLYKPDEIYNLAAQSHVRVSFDLSENTADGIVLGTLRLLNAYKTIIPESKYYQASSSEIYGINSKIPLNEESITIPSSISKLAAHHMVDVYRRSYGLFACSGILFNHESERRGETFVTRKITLAAARIKYGLQDKLYLGNLEAKRDWGHAKDYVEAMYLMLQQQTPEDYVICSGETHSIREFLDLTFEYAGLGDPMKYVEIDPKYFRPQEVPLLLGDYSKAKKNLGWIPKIKFEKLVKMMYDSDELLIKQEITKGSQKWKI